MFLNLYTSLIDLIFIGYFIDKKFEIISLTMSVYTYSLCNYLFKVSHIQESELIEKMYPRSFSFYEFIEVLISLLFALVKIYSRNILIE